MTYISTCTEYWYKEVNQTENIISFIQWWPYSRWHVKIINVMWSIRFLNVVGSNWTLVTGHHVTPTHFQLVDSMSDTTSFHVCVKFRYYFKVIDKMFLYHHNMNGFLSFFIKSPVTFSRCPVTPSVFVLLPPTLILSNMNKKKNIWLILTSHRSVHLLLTSKLLVLA